MNPRAIFAVALTVSLHTIALPPRPASAHEFTLESLVNAFVKLEPSEAQLVMRVPLHVLRAAKFPTTGREIDLADADPATAKQRVTEMADKLLANPVIESYRVEVLQ